VRRVSIRLKASKRSSSTTPPHVSPGYQLDGTLDLDARRSSQRRRQHASGDTPLPRWWRGVVSEMERARRRSRARGPEIRIG
jgi:hypothetical protein